MQLFLHSLDIFPAFHASVNEDPGADGKGLVAQLLEFFIVIGKAASQATERTSRTDNDWIAKLIGRHKTRRAWDLCPVGHKECIERAGFLDGGVQEIVIPRDGEYFDSTTQKASDLVKFQSDIQGQDRKGLDFVGCYKIGAGWSQVIMKWYINIICSP